MSAVLVGLTEYPVKSCAGNALETADVGALGFAHDRRWMLVDASGRFVTGRQAPTLVQVRALPIAGGVRVCAPGRPTLDIAQPSGEARLQTAVWGTAVDAADAGDAAATWFSAWLGREVRLAYADPQMQRPLDPRYAQPQDRTAFADGYPLLLLSQSACRELSERVGRPMDARRFRPNLLIDGVPAHAEDQWKRIRIGEIEFDVVKPCTRCVFTTIDPDLATPDPAGEPLHTLKQYRRGAAGITFGQNLIPRGSGTLRLGEPLSVLE